MPANVEWRQLNYGQGEGQVEIGGCEWGIYLPGRGEIALVLHSGEITSSAGVAFARSVGEAICGATPFELLIQATAG
jgi:hypothetical protein